MNDVSFIIDINLALVNTDTFSLSHFRLSCTVHVNLQDMYSTVASGNIDLLEELLLKPGADVNMKWVRKILLLLIFSKIYNLNPGEDVI